ncbi:MAG: DsbA family protein [Candidatus Bathyarchaeia archaeon]|jgi:predicted DsbA family dithiol-disulfide isomerase
MSHDQRIAVVHFTAPTCWWSWGYEPVFNRLKLVYGDQINVLTFYGTVYEDIEEYKKNYELDDAGMAAWAKEAQEIMGVPMHLNYRFDRMPKDMLPATLAVIAAERQGHEKGHRLYRALLRRNIVEDQDVTQEATIFGAVKEAGLDDTRFKSDWADQASLKTDLEKQGEGAPPVHVGFYNIAVTDGHGRSVYLDQQFQPSAVEGAINYLTDGQLRKAKPIDVLAYLKTQGPTSLVEVERVFDLPSNDATAELERLESLGMAKRSTLAGAPFWFV